MKWFLLVAIFAVAQYQGVTGCPPGQNVHHHTERHHTETHTSVRHAKKEILENYFKLLLNHTSLELENLIYNYEQINKRLEELSKNNKDQIILRDESEVNQQLLRSGRYGLIPPLPVIRGVPDKLSSYLSIKLEQAKLGYHEVIKNLQDIINNLKTYVTKNKNTKDQSTLENIASDDKKQVNATQTTSTLDESVVNQQSTPDKNDNKKEESEDGKEIKDLKTYVTENKDTKDQPTLENTASGDKTQVNAAQTTSTLDESVVNQQSTPGKNDDEEEKPKDNKEPLTSESTASSNKTQKVAIQMLKHPMYADEKDAGKNPTNLKILKNEEPPYDKSLKDYIHNIDKFLVPP